MLLIEWYQKIHFTPKMKTAIKVIVTLSLLLYLFIKLDVELVSKIGLRTDLRIFLLAFLIGCSINVFGALRWRKLLKAKNHNLPVGLLTRYYFIGIFFNFFFPTVVGGDIVRGYYLYNQGVEKEVTIGSIIVERVLGVASLMCLSLFSILWSFDLVKNAQIKAVVIISSMSFIGLFFLLFHNKTQTLIKKIVPSLAITKLKTFINLLRDVRDYNRVPGILVYAFFITILFQVFSVISTYLIAISIGCSTRFIYFLILLPIVWLVSMMPISINGLGLREGAFVFLFASIGMEKEVAFTISILFLLQGMAQGIIGSIFFVFDKINIKNIRVDPYSQ